MKLRLGKKLAIDLAVLFGLFVPIECVKWLMFHFANAEVIYVFVALPVFLLAYYRNALAAVGGLVFVIVVEHHLYAKPIGVRAFSATFLLPTSLMLTQQAVIIYFASHWRKWLADARAANRQLAEANRHRELLLGTLAHDLRTPITSIKATSSLLHKRGSIDSESLRRIDSGCKRLVRVIDHVIDMSSMHMGGGIQLHLTSFDLVTLAQRVIDEMFTVYPRSDIHLVTESAEIVGVWDETRIERAVSNLLSNACKYGRPGAPIIVRLEEDDHATVHIVVRNEGELISPELMAVLFDPFKRGVKKTQMMGVGLGLYITAEMIDKHGGSIEVRSTVEEGTTFTIVLPRECT